MRESPWTYKGQIFHRVASQDFETKRWGPTTLEYWKTRCPDCGKEFVFSLNPNTLYPVRRCRDCKAYKTPAR